MEKMFNSTNSTTNNLVSIIIDKYIEDTLSNNTRAKLL